MGVALAERKARGMRLGDAAAKLGVYEDENQFPHWQARLSRMEDDERKLLLGETAWQGVVDTQGMAAGDFWWAAVYLHVGLEIPFDFRPAHLRNIYPIVQDYFFGRWRASHSQFGYDHLDEQGCRQNLEWYGTYKMSLATSLLLGDIPIARRLSEYPDIDCGYQYCEPFSQEDLLEAILMARWLSHRTKGDETAIQDQIEKSRRRRPKLLLRCLQAIRNGDGDSLAAGLRDYMKHFMKFERDVSLLFLVSVDGTILWNLASLNGLRLPELPVELSDAILTPQSIGAEDREG